ncbi:MAG TPA: SDR family oxidoreductase [Verrucomicrobiae bacterium]|nr:SDR family oxidoreductase [Verrucomicrobiae bacterium]
MRALVIGCGYVGTPLAMRLVELGHEVWGVRRNQEALAELAPMDIKPFAADISEPGALDGLTGSFDWVVNLVSSDKGGPPEYRRVYVDGNRNLVEWARQHPVRKLVYTSSTSVYAQNDGSAVKESSPTEPTTETSQILLEAEKLLTAATPAVPAMILRVAGIYGPGRGHLFKQYLKNEAKIPGQGARITNMIHVDDLVEVIIAALKNGRAGETYNVVDDEPVALLHFYRWLSETLGKWMPPFAPEEQEPERKRAVTSKKVQNRKMKVELGVQLKYPTFRQGYTAEIRRLESAGQLNIDPEPR